jgi:hypothetical protein
VKARVISIYQFQLQCRVICRSPIYQPKFVPSVNVLSLGAKNGQTVGMKSNIAPKGVGIGGREEWEVDSE